MRQSNYPRETFEIILDTCSLGLKQLSGVEELIEYATKGANPAYKDYRIVMPVQIGTEVKRRIFSDFLQAELMLLPEEGQIRKSSLRAFYQKHYKHISVEETDVSIVYKMHYMHGAIEELKADPGLADEILGQATHLADRYKNILGRHEITERDFDRLLRKYEEYEAAEQASLARAEKGVFKHYSPHHVTLALIDAQFTAQARRGKTFLDSLTMPERYCLQAMYSCEPMLMRVSKQPDFMEFRADQGERAIESYLFNTRRKRDATVASAVVSEDKGARDGIKALRRFSQNSVLVVNNKGLETTLSILRGDYPYQHAAAPAVNGQNLSNSQRWAQAEDNPRRERIIEGRAQYATLEQALQRTMRSEPTELTEQQYSYRLAQLVKHGHWRSPHTQERTL